MKKNHFLSVFFAGLFCAMTFGICGCSNNKGNGGDVEPSKEEQVLKDKTFIFLGSSVTYGTASGGWSMCDYLVENCESTVYKWAVGGTTLVTSSENNYIQRMQNNAHTVTKADQFVCQLSTNDAGLNKPLGEVSNFFDITKFDTTTVIGAMEYIIAFVQEQWDCPVSFYTGTYFENENYQNMVDALKQLRRKWGIGIINLWEDEQMLAVIANQELYNSYMSDPIHPTKLGYEEWWGPKFEQYFLALYS